MTHVSEHIERLIVRRLDGEITAEESAELDREVLRDPEVRALLDSYVAIDALAATVLRESTERTAPRLVLPPAERTPRVHASQRGGWMLLASALAACLAVIVYLSTPEAKTLAPIAGGSSPAPTHFADRTTPVIDVARAGDNGVWRAQDLPARIDRTTDRNVLMVTDPQGNVYLLNLDVIREVERDGNSGMRYVNNPI